MRWLASILFLCGCVQRPANVDRRTEISGVIAYPGDSVVYFYSYKDSIDFFTDRMSALDSAVLDSAGRFTLHPPVTGGSVFSLRYGGGDLVANLYLRPGDRLEFRFRGRDRPPRIEPYGAAARFNTFLVQLQSAFYRDKDARLQYYIASNYMNFDVVAGYTDDRRKRMHAFFDSFFGGDSVPKEYSDFARCTIDYEFASDRIMYVWKKRMKGEPDRPDSAYFSFLQEGFIENDDAFVTPSYIRFLNLYLKETYESMVADGALHPQPAGPHAPSAEKYRLCMHLFTGRFRNAVLYNLVLNDRRDVTRRGGDAVPESRNLDTLLEAFRDKYAL